MRTIGVLTKPVNFKEEEQAALDWVNAIRKELHCTALTQLCRGARHKLDSCPIAVSLPGYVTVTRNQAIIELIEDKRTYDMPTDVELFVHDFDRGMFAHLEDR